MLIYITGASGSGKTTLLKQLPMRGYDLDDLYAANWKIHKKPATVQKGVQDDVAKLVAKHKDLVFVGMQGKEDLPFTPDAVYILVRKDYEDYYRQKLVRDLNLLCRYKKDYEEVFTKKPFDEFRLHFWSNSVVNMKSFEEFKKSVEKDTKILKKEFPKAPVVTAKEIVARLR